MIEELYNEFTQKKNVNTLVSKTKLFRDKGCVHWSEMTGKMRGKRAKGLPMTSTCAANKLIDGSICQLCYAEKINVIYPALGAALQRNRDLTTDDIYEDRPVFTEIDPTWRGNWNGDYEDEHDVLVDFALCEVLNYAIETAWTKNPQLIERLDSERPSNFTLMQSSPMINQQVEMSPSADQVFTIYTPEYAAENDIEINCIGACRLCNRCYGEISHRPTVVNELLKGSETKYFKLMGLDL